jgi:hypothetical protein
MATLDQRGWSLEKFWRIHESRRMTRVVLLQKVDVDSMWYLNSELKHQRDCPVNTRPDKKTYIDHNWDMMQTADSGIGKEATRS